MATTSQQTSAQILTATATDTEHATAALVLAFSTDPVCRWMWPDPQQYLTSFPSFVRAFGGPAFQRGTAHYVPGYGGAALWFAPGVEPDEDAIVNVIERTIEPEKLELGFAILERMGEYHPAEPHWYLPMIEIEPSLQGKGYGSALLQHTLLRCDAEHLPAYLESSNVKNVSLYQRHGFEVIGTIQVGDAPPLYPMQRTPR